MSAITPAEVRRALARVSRGANLDQGEVAALLAARDADLSALCDHAARLRDEGLRTAGRPGIITYSPKVFIPLTRLCRDSCHYCTFATDPADLRRSGEQMFLSPDEVVAIARRGAEVGCKEALFTLGDRPEDRWPAAREWLESAGFDSTLSYLRAMAILVLEQTGLLPHLNPGVMTWEELVRLRPVAPSMGMMLETTSERLFRTPGEVHYGSPDKDPAVRRRVLSDAGRAGIPFTTGLLIGIGESLPERADSILALRSLAREHRGVQEVIIQNFRAKPDTALRHRDDLDSAEYLAALATARVVLGPRIRIQAPPNLSAPAELAALLAAGVDDWGGVSPVTPDHVNPERPWPHLDVLRAATAAAGFELRERLTVHPEYVRQPELWLDPRVAGHVAALADDHGLARPGHNPVGRSWQQPDSYEEFAAITDGGHRQLSTAIDAGGRRGDRRGDFDTVFGDWTAIGEQALAVDRDSPRPDRPPQTFVGPELRAALRLAELDPAALAEERHADLAVALAAADGPALDELAAIADGLRRRVVGDDVTYVVNRNINFTNVCYTGCRFCAFAQRESDADAFTLGLDDIGSRVDEAVAAGATEICMQGGIHPKLPGHAYFDIAAEVKRRPVHLHAFSPMEVVNGATRSNMSIGDWLRAAREAGVDSIPGTAAEILDDDVRWVLTKGKLPAQAWEDVIRTAHGLGLRSSSTMMYGHVDSPRHWVGHLRRLRRIQLDTGGFTEFVGLPFVHHNAPIYLAGHARPGATPREDLAVTALARVMLHDAIPNIQVSWVKLGPEGCARLLRSGANDLGGTLMEETISRMAGSEHGSAMTPAELHATAALAGRTARERTTLYGLVEPGPTAAPPLVGVSEAPRARADSGDPEPIR